MQIGLLRAMIGCGDWPTLSTRNIIPRTEKGSVSSFAALPTNDETGHIPSPLCGKHETVAIAIPGGVGGS